MVLLLLTYSYKHSYATEQIVICIYSILNNLLICAILSMFVLHKYCKSWKY